MKRLPLVISFILFVALCVSGTYWVMHIFKPEPRKKVSPPPMEAPVADVESVATLFGGAMMVVTNFHLKGIIEANPASESVAILSTDGSPQKAYPMDTHITPGSELDGVFLNYILLKDNGVKKRVEMPQDNAAHQAITPVTPGAPNPAIGSVHNTAEPHPVTPNRNVRGPGGGPRFR